MLNKTTFFVNTDLLISEGAFASLRDFLNHYVDLDLQMYDTIDVDFCNDTPHIIIKHPDFPLMPSCINVEVFNRINKGYILINIDGLKKLVTP